MKRLIVAWALLIGIVLAGWSGQVYLKASAQKLEAQVEEIQKLGENSQWSQTEASSGRLQQEWDVIHGWLCLYLDHTLLENIEKEIALLPHFSTEQNLTELQRHCVLIKSYVRHLAQSEALNLKNIL